MRKVLFVASMIVIVFIVSGKCLALTWDIDTVDPTTNQEGGTLSLAFDPATSTPHIVYSAPGTPTKIRYATFNGETWSIDTIADFGGSGLRIALNPDGVPNILYGANYDNAWYLVTKNGSWSSPDVIQSGVFAGWQPSMAINSSGEIHVAYFNNTPNHTHIWKSGDTWNSPEIRYGNASFSDMKFDTFDRLHKVYQGGTDPNMVLFYDKRVNGVWEISAMPIFEIGKPIAIAIDLDSSQNPHIIFSDRVDENHTILKYIYFDGNEWRNDLSPDFDVLNIWGYGSIILDSQDRVHVSYLEQNRQMYARLDGSGWHPEEVQPGHSSAGQSSIALNNNGLPVIAFYDTTDNALKYGQGGSSGYLEKFIISKPDGNNIDSPQTINIPFEVKITARDNNGNLLTTFNQEVLLSSTAGEINPKYVSLVDGEKTVQVKLLDAGNDIAINLSGAGQIGQSNMFDVSNPGASMLGSISGSVKGPDKTPINGADVKIYKVSPKNGGTPYDTETTINGVFEFNDIPCGKYYLQADDNHAYSQVNECFVPCDQTVTEDLIISPCNIDGRIPILLVPGILGSDSKYRPGSIIPELPNVPPSWDSGKLKLHDPGGIVGWRNLKRKLHEELGYTENCTMFDVPYDWTISVADAANIYLKPWIDEAKLRAGTSKVNVVAHSMGGLVTRAYIQSADYNNRKDIDRFAMVGTPNHGSANAYYIWEGGDAKKADDLTSDWYQISEYINVYSNTLNKLHIKLKHYPICLPNLLIPDELLCNKRKTYDLVHHHVPSLMQLMPTYPFPLEDEYLPRDIIEEENMFLKALNHNDCYEDNCGFYYGKYIAPGDIMVNDNSSDQDKVMTKLFIGTDKKTIKNIPVGSPPQSGLFYKDGVPRKDPKRDEIGDGTVPALESAQLNFLEPPEYLEGGHGSLIKIFSDNDDFMNFITDGRYSQGAARIIEISTTEADTGSSIYLNISGRVQPYLVDPLGNGCGINYSTGTREQNIAGCADTLSSGTSGISVENPTDGLYSLYLKGIYDEEIVLSIGYIDDHKTINSINFAFIHSNSIVVNFIVNSMHETPITISHTPLQPSGIAAIPFQESGLKTALTWEASTDPDVASYNVYSKLVTEPFFKLLGSSPIPTFNTDHLWASNSSISTRIYVVSALKTDGTESFLSNFALNNDRDNDGLTDEEEIAYGTEFDNPDTDSDKLTDGEEYNRGTNALVEDTDEDSFSDYWEVLEESDPLNINSIPACEGDFDPSDGTVNETDLIIFLADFGRSDCDQGEICEGDFNNDNDVDGSELIKLIRDFGRENCPL
jgi:pimeloyl-ACP methyl ester carboxylesterase